MTPWQKTSPSLTVRSGTETGLLFALLLAYTALVIEPRLVHQSIGIFTCSAPFSYSMGWPFFYEHFERPGGLVEYMARWLTQYFEFNWLGGLIIAASAWSLAVGTDRLIQAAGGPRRTLARYVPALLLIAIWGEYSHPLPAALALLVALGLFALYVLIAHRGMTTAIAGLLVAGSIAYYLAGAVGLMFGVLVTLYEFLSTRRLRLAALALVVTVILPWLVGMFFCDCTWRTAYGTNIVAVPSIHGGSRPFLTALYLFFPLAITVTALLSRFLASRLAGPEQHDSEHDSNATFTERMSRLIPGTRLRWALGLIVVLVAGYAIAWFAHDRPSKLVLEIDYYAQREMWTETLRAADRMPKGQFHVHCNRNIMLALYHTGRLGDEMFRYAQVPGVGLFNVPKAERGPASFFLDSRLFLELGEVNLAQKWASEALECDGDSPKILKQLAIINVLKGRPDGARMFLTALSKKPLHRREALRMLEQLDKDPQLECNPEVRCIRRCMILEDDVMALDVDQMLIKLLQRNPRNQMAFELLLAHYLHVCNPERVVYWLQQPTGFEFPRLPRHYQEAVVIYSIMTNNKFPDASETLDQEVIDQAVEMDEILGTYGRATHRTQAAAVAAGLGDSYYFYFNFHTSGL